MFINHQQMEEPRNQIQVIIIHDQEVNQISQFNMHEKYI